MDRTLASEEPSIVSLALAPGRVDTAVGLGLDCIMLNIDLKYCTDANRITGRRSAAHEGD
jgi:hypothetical protein